MGDVINLNDRRPKSRNYQCLNCGSEWFDLVRAAGPIFRTETERLLHSQPGSMLLSQDAKRVVGYVGRFVCHECKTSVPLG